MNRYWRLDCSSRLRRGCPLRGQLYGGTGAATAETEANADRYIIRIRYNPSKDPPVSLLQIGSMQMRREREEMVVFSHTHTRWRSNYIAIPILPWRWGGLRSTPTRFPVCAKIGLPGRLEQGCDRVCVLPLRVVRSTSPKCEPVSRACCLLSSPYLFISDIWLVLLLLRIAFFTYQGGPAQNQGYDRQPPRRTDPQDRRAKVSSATLARARAQ